MGNFCNCECVHELSDNLLEKFGSSTNPYMEPISQITVSDSTTEDLQILDTLIKSNAIGESSGNPKMIYDFKSKIVETPSGTIYLIQKKDTKELRMMKSLNKKKDSKNIISQQLKKDIENLQKLSHPNILKLYEVYDNEKYLSYVTEYCEGGALSQNIKNFKKQSEVQIACIIYQVLLALNYCHKNKVVHTCLNPDFILLKSKLKKGYPEIKLYGFGLSKVYLDNPTQSEYAPNYFSPEILLDIYNDKCDLWSCGVILHVLLSGKFPFKGKNAEEVCQQIKDGNFKLDEYFFKKSSNSAKDLITKLIKKIPEERLSAEEALQHEWFKELKIQDKLSELKLSVIQELFNNIKKFKITNQLQIPVLEFLVKNVSTEEENINACKLFSILDTNNDGVITKEEFVEKMTELFEEQKQKISREELLNVFNLLDFDVKNSSRGKIHFKELGIAVCNKASMLKEEHLEKAFAFFDKGNNKKISLDDLRNTFKNDKAYNEKDFQEMINKVDINKDGSIDYNEFKKMMVEILLVSN